MKKVLLYTLIMFGLGLFFSGVTIHFIQFLPYFFVGMVITSPVYGLVRSKFKAPSLKGLIKFKKLRNLRGKKSVMVYGIILIVVYHAHVEIVEAVLNSIGYGVIALIVTFAVWEAVRKFSKKSFMSFGEAFKRAF